MDKYGLIGKDISYSVSPKLHELISEKLNIDVSYDLIDVEENEIKKYVEKLRTNKYKGFNITKPYKEVITKYIDELSPIAIKTGSVNTIYHKDNKIYGDNTDYYGLEYLIENNKINCNNKKVAILGTGGAAKTSYYLMSEHTKDVVMVSRNKSDKNIISYNDMKDGHYDIIIQATPVGTYPNTKKSPLQKEKVKNAIVIDLIYNPIETQIMKYSKKGYNGIEMLIIQALYAQNLWNNKSLKLTKEEVENIKEDLYEYIWKNN